MRLVSCVHLIIPSICCFPWNVAKHVQDACHRLVVAVATNKECDFYIDAKVKQVEYISFDFPDLKSEHLPGL